MKDFDKAEAIRDLYHCHNKQDLAKMVVEQHEELANCQRMYANASATLGEIQGYLGNGIVGIEPRLVKQVIDERDELAAHVEQLRQAALNAIHTIPGGDVKAKLRDAYDETHEANLARFQRQYQEDAK